MYFWRVTLNKKVLLSIVTYENKDYIWNEFINNINNLSYDNYDVIIVDNSKNINYYETLKTRLKDTNYIVKHVSRGDTSREAQAKSLNCIRDYFLNGDYDYLMNIESDLIPPINIIERLMSRDKLVVGGLYNIGFYNNPKEPLRPCLFGIKKINGILKTFNIPPSDGWSFFGNGLIKIHGMGIGCVLIHKLIIQKFKFWFYLDKVVKHSDVLFYMDLRNNGYDVFIDTDIIIPHYNTDWKYVKDK